RTYLGLMVAGFPNLFTITGPGSPSVLVNMIAAIEQHVDWIARLVGRMRDAGETRVEASEAAQEDWVDEVRRVADTTLYPLANSWYNGDNIAGKPRMFMAYVGGYPAYAARCEEIAAAGYPGFEMSA
ncbi:MAG: cyclohexanone monooxygenase, partial [Novosphingobium sp.]|nr:cyclohexanone monooxygenase [Novosphingobium sp.]